MNLVEIPRHTGDLGDVKPPWWMPIADNVQVLLACPKDHRRMTQHEIGLSGIVTPSLLCPDCGWHVMGRLMDWKVPLATK